jgi:hypothetical protein
MTAAVTSFPLSKVAGQGPPLLPSLTSLFIYIVSLRDCPFPTLLGWGAPPSLLRVFCFFFFNSAAYLLFSLFFSLFFPPWAGSICPGDYADLAQGCLWEYLVLLSSPGGLSLPKQSGSWPLSAQEPSWFLRLTWSWGCYMRAGSVVPLLGGFSCKAYIQCHSKILL